MSWHKTAAVVTLMLAPMFAAGTDAVAASIVTTSSSSDAAWLATQLHQMHFAKGADQSLDSYDRVDASAVGDGPHVIGLHSAGSAGATGVVPAAGCAALSRHQSDRTQDPLVRGFRQHDFAPRGIQRHRLGGGTLVRAVWPAGVRAGAGRHRRVAASCRICRGLRRSRADPCRQRQPQSSRR
jgi:hypothetical protein